MGGRKCEIKCQEEEESENPKTYPSLCPSVRPSPVLGCIFKTHTVWMNNERQRGGEILRKGHGNSIFHSC